LELTWIAHGGLIYQVVGLAPAKRFQALQPVFQAVARSFRPLSASERANVTEKRIRLAKARAGETIEDLTSRTHSAWKKEEVAVANGLTLTDRLHEGQMLKVAIKERYKVGNRR
jgi:predicted Zn-dependent protease